MTSISLLGIAGSLRRASTNRGLLRAAQAQLPVGAHLDIADLTDIPFYNADIAAKPAAVSRLLAQIGAADGLVLACTEYNYSLAPALKNILDWASREPDNALGTMDRFRKELNSDYCDILLIHCLLSGLQSASVKRSRSFLAALIPIVTASFLPCANFLSSLIRLVLSLGYCSIYLLITISVSSVEQSFTTITSYSG